MGITWEPGRLLQKTTDRPCPLKYEGEPVPWERIAEWLAEEEGCQVTRETVRVSFEKTLRNIRDRLVEDPDVRDWLLENNIEIERHS